MKQIAILTGAIFAFFLVACSKSDEGGASNKNPIITGKASNVTFQSATIECFVNAESFSKIGVVLSDKNPNPTLDGSSVHYYTTTNLVGNRYTIDLKELKSNTTYYYRAFYFANNVNNYGEVKNFKTDDIKISATTKPATEVHAFDATLNGICLINGKAPTDDLGVHIFFEISGNKDMLHTYACRYNAKHLGNGNFSVKVERALWEDGNSYSILDLRENNTYYFRVVAVADNGIFVSGDILSFKTLPLVKSFAIRGVSISNKIATISGTVTWFDSPGDIWLRFFCSYSGIQNLKLPDGINGDFSFNLDLSRYGSGHYTVWFVAVKKNLKETQVSDITSTDRLQFDASL